MSSCAYPRLLFITSSAFNPISGGGITFTNLFTGWPKDKIATVHNDQITTSTDVCAQYYQLGNAEFRWQFPFSLIQPNDRSPTKILPATNTPDDRGNRPIRRMNFARSIMRLWTGDEIPTRARLTQSLEQWIVAFNPQVLYAILGSLPFMELVEAIAKKFHLPMVIHMMDDWPAVLYRKGLYDLYRRSRMERLLAQMTKQAVACLGICDAMSKAYAVRYGVPFTSFHNTVDVASWVAKGRKEWKRGNPFVLLYAGALMPRSQLQSVREVARAVAALGSAGEHIEFHIYGLPPDIAAQRLTLEIAPNILVREVPATMDIVSLFARADLLVLPVNFDQASVNYIHYSMPTKVPAYMCCGIPTLAYGPNSAASIQYAKEWAYCIERQDQRALKDAIIRLASDEELRKALALKSQAIARERHDVLQVRPAFHRLLQQAASISYGS